MIIRSRQEGFRRCGVAFSKTATEYPDKTFTPAQLEIIKAEPMLIVEISGNESKPAVKAPTAAEQIEKIKAAATVEEIVTILGDDKRATVLSAAEVRNAELETPPE